MAAPKVCAVCSPGTEFQTLAIRLEAKVWQPGTGGRMFSEFSDLVDLKHVEKDIFQEDPWSA